MSILSSLLSSKESTSNAFYLIQSSAAQSALPVLRGLINAQTNLNLVLICSLYAPANLLGPARLKSASGSGPADSQLNVIDWTEDVPGFSVPDVPVDWKKRLEEIQSVVKESSKPVAVVIDSVDTLNDDLESPSETYKFISRILASITSRKDSSKLICHITALSPILPSLKQPRFSPSLIHLIAHPPALLTHIAQAYLTQPPPSTTPPCSPDALKFWRVFIPLAERPHDVERLVFGPDAGAEGSGHARELIVEVLVRGRGADLPVFFTAPQGSVKRKGVERVLEGWSVAKSGPISLEELDSLRGIWRKKKNVVEQNAPDPTKDLTFNLSLTDSQQASRSQVPLPYEHDGRAPQTQNQSAQIYYDPDSADDLDDEDPDEDLDL